MRLRNITRLRSLSILAAAGMLFLFAGCGGGSSSSPGDASAKVTLSGTVATGAPVANATVIIKDAKGLTTETTTDSDGKYSVTLTGSGPWILQAPNPDGTKMYSYAAASGTVNIHPLTDLIVRRCYSDEYLIDDKFASTDPMLIPTEEAVKISKDEVYTTVEPLLVAASVDPSFDLIQSEFTATAEPTKGFDMVIHYTTIEYTLQAEPIKIVPTGELLAIYEPIMYEPITITPIIYDPIKMPIKTL